MNLPPYNIQIDPILAELLFSTWHRIYPETREVYFNFVDLCREPNPHDKAFYMLPFPFRWRAPEELGWGLIRALADGSRPGSEKNSVDLGKSSTSRLEVFLKIPALQGNHRRQVIAQAREVLSLEGILQHRDYTEYARIKSLRRASYISAIRSLRKMSYQDRSHPSVLIPQVVRFQNLVSIIGSKEDFSKL